MTTVGPAASVDASARQSSVREHNLAVVAAQVFGSRGPISRADLAVASGLNPSTVSRLVDELVVRGLLQENEPSGAAGRGRPATPVSPRGQSIAALGLEVNASRTVVRLIDLTGQVLGESITRGSFAGARPDAVFADLAGRAQTLVAIAPAEVRLAGVGVCLPGMVNRSGTLVRSQLLGWHDLALPGLLTGVLTDTDLGVVLLSNEAEMAAHTITERAPGQYGDLRRFLYVAAEADLSAAVVLDGQVVTGQLGWTGALGHVLVAPDGRPCACGAAGCLEAYAALPVVLADAGVATVGELRQAVDEDTHDTARTVVHSLARHLGGALASVLALVDVDTIVLGGYLAALGDTVVPLVQQTLERRLGTSDRQVSVVSGPLEEAPGATGAAYAVLGEIIAAPGHWLADRTED